MARNTRKMSSAAVDAGPREVRAAPDTQVPRSGPLTLSGAAVAALMVTAAVSAAEPEVGAGAAEVYGQQPPPPQIAAAVGQAGSESQTAPQGSPAPDDMVPRWLEAVRAQRRALQERRRAQHQARRRALDPVGTARQEAMEDEFQRRRQEMRDMIAQDRWLFLNFGPWLAPLPTPPGISAPAWPTAPDPARDPADDTEPAQPANDPPEWDNGWYFRGW